MRLLEINEIAEVNGGYNYSGYQAAGAIMTVVAFGAIFSPIGAITGGIAIGSAVGLGIAQGIADFDDDDS